MDETILYYDGNQFGLDTNLESSSMAPDYYFMINGFDHFSLKQLLVMVSVLNNSNVPRVLNETVVR